MKKNCAVLSHFHSRPHEYHFRPASLCLEAFLPKQKEQLLVAHRALGRCPRNLDSAQGNNSSKSGGHQPLTHLSSLGFCIYMPK
jgi:hypothetical protein